MTVIIDQMLTWRDVARVGAGEALVLSAAAWARIEQASRIVERIVETGVRAYGVNTGVGALADTVVDRASQSLLSRSIVLSHACGVGPLLAGREVRAIIAAQIANFAHGHSGVRREIVQHLTALLEHDCIPDVPSKGSAGYLTHNAHTALVLIGEGSANVAGRRMSGREALAAIGLQPLLLGAKEGLSLVNGTACATGLTATGLLRAERLLDWADAIAALTLEAAGCQIAAFDKAVLSLRPSTGIEKVGAALRARLAGSGLVAASLGRRTQDALSLRSVPHAHGAARDVFDNSARITDQELASVTDNPAVSGTPEQPVVSSEAHAVAPALGQAADSLAIALAQIGAISERRMDRLVNPLVSGLPPFLASDAGSHSGFMIAQYTAAALSNENRRLAAPAALDGGLTSALQEDFLAHPTAAADKLLAVIDNAEYILAIELMAAAQAHDFLAATAPRAAGTDILYRAVRQRISHYDDQRPLNGDIEAVRSLIRETAPPAI
ncbi:histidine ammonia-lyase [Rhizobium lentis]|uniref:Histidine ammonia-lyase n=1 Tax=Rhizobium lentis TaxID=1138194 RepID=A0A7W9CX84_9HYPH|nr:histidine ammonia-lyase [Rhizobium lentis]MBB4576440.1 histidine ammonia-lyase [Rhizobium lentis]MBB5552693.1 histidine ammonia-lyase [Rhizobium lentis]MBB5563233.1 histidine ammonia-lyase [Rhizobium lentis]MBB5569510.1 histidine ammonia-lyase [Rhizobium lentis]